MLIFGMCDESFAINASTEVPVDIDHGWFMLWVTLLNYIYWIGGTVLGWLAGGALPFSVKGVEFAMVGMFVTVFLERWDASPRNLKGHLPALVGLVVCMICLVIFGSKNFILPALVGMLVVFALLRPYLSELKDDEAVDDSIGADGAAPVDQGFGGEV